MILCKTTFSLQSLSTHTHTHIVRLKVFKKVVVLLENNPTIDIYYALRVSYVYDVGDHDDNNIDIHLMPALIRSILAVKHASKVIYT